MINNGIDINKLLEENYIVPESVFDKKRTKTSHFMLNTIFPNNSLLSIEFFVNAFLNDEAYEHNIQRPLFVLFKTDLKDPKWDIVLKKLRSKPEYVLEYFVGYQNKKALLMLVFEVPDKYTKEYSLFKEGKYSEFSNGYKETFPRYIHTEKGAPQESTIWRVLYKSKELRKELQNWIGDSYVFTEQDELWGIPTPKYEHYRHK